jgi:hypothetical protein
VIAAMKLVTKKVDENAIAAEISRPIMLGIEERVSSASGAVVAKQIIAISVRKHSRRWRGSRASLRSIAPPALRSAGSFRPFEISLYCGSDKLAGSDSGRSVSPTPLKSPTSHVCLRIFNPW